MYNIVVNSNYTNNYVSDSLANKYNAGAKDNFYIEMLKKHLIYYLKDEKLNIHGVDNFL